MATLDPQDQLLADLATGLWRLRHRFVDSATGVAPEVNRRPLRDVDALLQRLEEHGVEIQDHDGQPYDATLSLRVAAFQPNARTTCEVILETLKPTVYLRQIRIQIGEVIVGLPEKP